MANTVTFLKNHQKFAWKVRWISAQIYLEKFKHAVNDEEKKVAMLRIVEELILSTEDLAMWIAAIESGKTPSKKNRDIWEFLLQADATDKQIIKILNDTGRAKTGKGLAKKLKLSPLSKLALAAKTDEQSLLKVLDEILKAIKESKHNRTARKGLLLRFHNKVKHGMMVQDYGHELFVRDLKTKTNNKTNRITRRNRNIYLQINLARAEQMAGTVEANCYALRGLVSLAIYDFIEQLINRKRKLTKRQIEFWNEALND